MYTDVSAFFAAAARARTAIARFGADSWHLHSLQDAVPATET